VLHFVVPFLLLLSRDLKHSPRWLGSIALAGVWVSTLTMLGTGQADALFYLRLVFIVALVLGICAALPELTTALVSILKGQRDISAGILIGSNITNPLFGAGLGALISGYTVPAVIMVYDLPVKIATGALLFIFLWRNENLSRYGALILLALYFGYVLLRAAFFPDDF